MYFSVFNSIETLNAKESRTKLWRIMAYIIALFIVITPISKRLNKTVTFHLANSLKEQEPKLGKFKFDESYFWTHWIHGKRECCVARKIPCIWADKKIGKYLFLIVPKASLFIWFNGDPWQNLLSILIDWRYMMTLFLATLQ